MKFALMRKIAWAGVVSALVFSVVAISLLLVLYLPQIHRETGLPRIKYPSSGFWWCLFSMTWALLLVIPYLAYFLRANGWCAACCGGHQQYHLSSMFKSVTDEDTPQGEASHPGRKRPILSKNAKVVLHVCMLIVGVMIIISSLISFFCLALILKDISGAAWAFITMAIGASYLGVIAFVFKQLRVRDQKRDLVSSSPHIVRRVLSDSEESYGRRWGLVYGRQDSGASDTESLLSDSDTRHILHTSVLTETELRHTSHTITEEYDDDDGLLNHQNDDRLDLDENILASQLSGHAPFSLSKQSPESSCAISIQRALTVFAFLILALVVTLMFSFQLLSTYQIVSMAVDSHLVPPTGTFYAGSSSYTFRLHLFCEGPPTSLFTPTVVIETDWASVSYEWSMVTERLIQSHQGLRVCRYDRAGYGWSEPGVKPREAKTEAIELQKILSDARELGPLILVSNGYGSFIHRIFTKLTNFNIMAMVMVDALHENEASEYLKALDISAERGLQLKEDEADSFFAKKLLAPIAISRLQIQTATQLNSIDKRKQLAAKGQLGYPDAVWSEFSNMFGLSQQAVSESRSKWGTESFPLALVVSEYRINGTCEQNRISHDKCALFLDSRDDLGDLPMMLQRDLLKLSTKSELIMAKKSSSYVHLEQPDFLSQVIIQAAKRSFNVSFIAAHLPVTS